MALSQPVVMGILNVTPDSFSDGGQYIGQEAAIAHAGEMLAAGAAIVDIGGESTRPGFSPVDVREEMRRVVPAVHAIRTAHPHSVISVDTMKVAVAEAALDAGADIINDVSGPSNPRMFDIVRDAGAGLVVMHGYRAHLTGVCDGDPDTLGMRVAAGLRALLDEAEAKGIDLECVCVDPGFGFGKKGGENGALLRAVPQILSCCGRPVLIGASRKHFVNGLYPDEGGDAVRASLRFAADALKAGGKIFRVHDVVETCAALSIAVE